MKRAFYCFSAFILISFLVLGSLIGYQAHLYAQQEIENKIIRDLEILATITQGAIAQGDYERIEEQVQLWGGKDPNIVVIRVILDGARPIVEFVRETQASISIHNKRTVTSLAGGNITFESIYDLAEHKRETLVFLIKFFSVCGAVAAVFISSLWLILKRLAILPLQQAGEALRVEKSKLVNILDSMVDGVYIVDQHYDIEYVNPALKEEFGEVEGLKCYEYFHKRQEVCPWCRIKEVLRGETLHWEWTSPTNGRSYDRLESPIALSDGSTGKLQILRDITERKQTEKQLHRAQKMEAVGMMAGGVAHDLNNILAGIVNYPELMLLKLPASSELRRPLTAVRDSGRRAAAVVADLLTVARGVASPRKPYDINLLIQEYLDSPECQQLKTEHPGVTCTGQCDAESPIINCSVIHINKTLMNLTTNAVEAVGDAGSIIISTCNCQIDEAEGLEKNMEPGDYVILTAQDNGPGIPEKDLKHIFEPFYTRKVMGQSGTGLGLAVVWNTVQDHNGKIFVESNEKGTRFQLYFPISTTESIVQPENDQTLNFTGKGEHILVVDDEPQLRDIASQILQSLNYQVDSVSSGEQAIEFIKKKPVDLIVLDMLMEPGINGRQTYAEIIKQYPNQKAIIASGFSESDDVKMTLQLGASEFIGKPYSLGKLGRAVKNVLGR